MKNRLLLFLATWLVAFNNLAVSYFVAPSGNDENPGTESQPWKSIQYASSQTKPGDIVMVQPGVYQERVSTQNGGTNNTERITFTANGSVQLLGWRINHPFVTIRGFHMTGWSAPSTLTANVEVTRTGTDFLMENCVVRDGVQVVRNDMYFEAGENVIRSATGGFINAGFSPGQTIWVGQGSPSGGIHSDNTGGHSILEVTDTTIKVNKTLRSEGPITTYISGSYVYAIALRPGSSKAVIRGNKFTNLSYDAFFVLGDNHRFENNLIEAVSGWDAMHFGGNDHVFRGNIIRNSPLIIYQNSPDALENYAPYPYRNVLFENNLIMGFTGILAAQKGENTSTGLVFSRNIFIDIGRISLTHPGTVFEHNFFLRVAKTNSPVNSVSRHPISIAANRGATNNTILNNLFIDCGQPSGGISQSGVGWYEFTGIDPTFLAAGNFVSGGAPDYSPKTGWGELVSDLNGGNPGLINIKDPLGPDGLPFTDDDGLRPRNDSKLLGAGFNGATPGPYETPTTVRPSLALSPQGPQSAQLIWSADFANWKPQSAPSATGPWTALPQEPLTSGTMVYIPVEISSTHLFFRLVNQ